MSGKAEMKYIGAFKTLRDAQAKASEFFSSFTKCKCSAGNYVYYTDYTTYGMWIYKENYKWHLIQCPDGTWENL